MENRISEQLVATAAKKVWNAPKLRRFEEFAASANTSTGVVPDAPFPGSFS